MNLLTDSWISVRRVDGTRDCISPLDILQDSAENPVQRIDSVRPDFEGSLYQFLIGLYQILLSPKDTEAWWDLFEETPEPETLRERIDLLIPAFELDAGEHRFMQDIRLPSLSKSKKDNTESKRTDIRKCLLDYTSKMFVKEGTIQKICPKCAASALITAQLNATGGGSGHRESIRKGGPLTTLIFSLGPEERLWKTLILNILPIPEYPYQTDMSSFWKGGKENLPLVFPWLDENPTSESEKNIVYPLESSEREKLGLHPYHVYWNVPRRILLDFGDTESGVCDLCGEVSDRLVHKFWWVNHGALYERSLWRHPLSPYSKKKNSPTLEPIGAAAEPLTYRNWMGYVVQMDSSKNIVPATVVQECMRRMEGEVDVSDLKVYAFGYAASSAKVRYWQDALYPTVLVPEEFSQDFLRNVNQIIDCAVMIQTSLKNCFNLAYLGDEMSHGDKMKRNISTTELTQAFWSRTEPDFYQAISSIANVKSCDEDVIQSIKRKWLDSILRITKDELFPEYVPFVTTGGVNPERVARAHISLKKKLIRNNKSLLQKLGIL